MIVDVNCRRYDVRFRKQKVDHPEKKNSVLINTFCTISSVDFSKQGRDKFTPVSTGEAKQSVKDNYDKIVGKKISMTRALKQVFSRPERAVFWENFKNQFGFKPAKGK